MNKNREDLEKRIRADEILLQACINSPEDMIILAIDKNYNYLTFNTFHQRVMLEAYGSSVSSGMNILKCITNKEDIAKSKINYEKAFSGESHITIEEYGELDRQYYETRYNPIYNEKREVIGATAFSSNVTQRRKTEESLRRSEELFRKAFITSPDAININRLSDGMYISINEGFTRISGYTSDEVIGKTSLELEIWTDPGIRQKLVNQLKTKGKAEGLETEFRMKNGDIRFGMMSAIVIDLDGIQHILSITKDITEKKNLEKELRSNEIFFKDIFDNVSIGVLHASKDGKILAFNKALEEIADLPKEKILGVNLMKIIRELLTPENRKIAIPALKKLLKGESIKPFRFEYRNKIIEVSASNNENFERITGVIRDITELIKAEETIKAKMTELELNKLATLNLLEDIKAEMEQRKLAEEIMLKRSEELRLSEEKFKNIFEEAPVGKSLTSLDDIIIPNKAFCHLLGYSRKELKNIDWHQFTHPDDIKKNEDIISSILKGEKKTARWEKRFIRKDGEIIWVDISTTLLRDRNGNPLHFITTVIDITEKKRSEEKVIQLNLMLEKRVSDRTIQLQEANMELEAFAYSVSHDLRAPLRAIEGYSKFVIEGYGPTLDNEGNRLLGLVRANTLKMDKLITDILALSRVSRSEHRFSEVDMEKMAVSMFNECLVAGVKKNVNMVFKPMPRAIGDPTYLKIVWTNLISNAIKFSSGMRNPEIETGGYTENGFNIYYIKDNGVGFNQDYAFKLFGVFQRLHKSEDFEGTGVGLAIVQRIIHRHEGKVWAQGIENEGATFFFSLPEKRIV